MGSFQALVLLILTDLVMSLPEMMIPQMFPGVELRLPEGLAAFRDQIQIQSCLRTRELYLYAPLYPYVICYDTRQFLFSWVRALEPPSGLQKVPEIGKISIACPIGAAFQGVNMAVSFKGLKEVHVYKSHDPTRD